MNQEYKIKILVMAVIALALINLSTIATVVVKREKQSDPGVGRMSNDAPANYKGHFFTFYLMLDSVQIDRFKEINERYLKEKKEYSKEIGKQTVMLAQHINGGGDRMGEMGYYNRIIDLHKRMKYANYSYYLSFRNICDQRQEELLDTFFSSILCIDRSLCDYLLYTPSGEPFQMKDFNSITDKTIENITNND